MASNAFGDIDGLAPLCPRIIDHVGIGSAGPQRARSAAGSARGTGRGSVAARRTTGNDHVGAEMRAEVLGDLREFGLTGFGTATNHGVHYRRPLVACPAFAHDDVRTMARGATYLLSDFP